MAFYMFEPSLKTASCFQIKSPPPAFTFDWVLWTSVLESMIRNPCTFTELKDEMCISFEVMVLFILIWCPLDQLKSDSIVNYRLFRDSELKLWCVYIDPAPVQLPLYSTDDDELPHKMLHLGLNGKLWHIATCRV